MRERISDLLKGKKGYAVQEFSDQYSTILRHTELPLDKYESKNSVPGFIDECSSGWIRIEDEFWEWTGDNAVCYLCKMNAKVSAET